MYAGDKRLIPHKVRISTKIALFWQMWHKGYMPLTVAIRTFFH